MSGFDRAKFYKSVRDSLFGGALKQSQVDGLEALIDEFEAREIDSRWFAYILGTAFHEVARTMQPIEEYGKGKGKPYRPYYGRGFVQLTWEDNYRKMSNKLGHDLVGNPALALRLDIAVQVIFAGMIDGDFSKDKKGKVHNLKRYFNKDVSDWYNARRIVNLLDKAHTIEKYSLKFYKAILVAQGTSRARAEIFIRDLEVEDRAEDTASDFSVREEIAFLLNDEDI